MKTDPLLRVAIKLSRGIHKIVNAELTAKDGSVFPCHHSGMDTESKIYSFGQQKKETLHTHVVVPAYSKIGESYNVFDKIEKGDTVTVRSLYRSALSHRLRVATLAQDEASVSFSATLPS